MENILREKQVRQVTGLSRVQRWRMIRAGLFPAPLQLGPNSIGWTESSIEQWQRSRPAVTYAPANKKSALESLPAPRHPAGDLG